MEPTLARAVGNPDTQQPIEEREGRPKRVPKRKVDLYDIAYEQDAAKAQARKTAKSQQAGAKRQKKK